MRLQDRLINVVRSLYSEPLIFRLKATLYVVDLCGVCLAPLTNYTMKRQSQ